MANRNPESGNGRSLSRRQFLRGAAAAGGAAAAFPYIIPSSAWGAEGMAAPSNRINLGIIGLGKLGRDAHLPSFLGVADVQVVMLCDVESERLESARAMAAKAYSERFGTGDYSGPDTTADFLELLGREDIDAVVVATPDHWHGLVAVAAAKAGKDIYCEKPMTHTIEEGRATVEAVRRYGRVFQTGSQQRSEYGGMFRRAAELVRSGILGDIKSVEIGVGGPPLQNYSLPSEPAPPTLDWNRWLGPAPWRPYNSTLCPMNYPGWPEWRNYRDIGGGGFSDFGAHHFDIAQWALGMDDSGPVEIIPPDGKEHDRLVFVYANGVPMYHGAEADCVFNGTKGRILVSRGFLRAEPESILDTKLGPGDVHLDRGRNHRDDWLHCIRTRERPIADAEIGHRTATICQLGIIAFELNRPLRWDPESERFMGDDEANRLIGRPMRGPWRI